MAIGLGKMFGFQLKENFNYPYVARSVTDFWSRWHISLTSWFRNYVYNPLGGDDPDPIKAEKKGRNYLLTRNIFLLWLLIGLWHGIGWTFVAWAVWYFLFLLLERITKLHQRNIPSVVGHTYLILIVMIGWVFFRSENMSLAFDYLGNLLGLKNNGFFSATALALLRTNWLYFVLGVVFCTPFARILGEKLRKRELGLWNTVFSIAFPIIIAGVYIISVIYVIKGNYVPFIYFNF
jgi:alginate O-acetyltransferase complex protein AlgI